ncbi:hypothetical protein L6164_010917 [Bauhinia variegata]|uniref:Uncharacterized protein n=1 Tax=Bauhinia variegata TaxID=167791 RepID=A0ACB9P4B0_BAUVA|nr:hypothetical protein L6164_010917 [Bauhinia variegata]
MELIHNLLNAIFVPSAFVALIFFVPTYYFIKFLWFIKRSQRAENVAGKVVLITGASSGIGENLAYEYARRGARLALVARREDRLRAVLENARRLGSPDATMICADVSKIEDCERFIHHTLDHFGQLDHLVNNAGILQCKLFQDMSPRLSDLAPILDVNFWGSVYATHFAIPYLRKSRGRIVVISSLAAWYPTPKMSFYNASKAALNSFFATLRAEFGPDIGITIVTPGVIQSEMVQNQFKPEIGVNGMPIQSTESCAKAIVDSACRGDLHLTEPFWARSLVWIQMFCPVLVEWFLYNFLVKRSAGAAQKKA